MPEGFMRVWLVVGTDNNYESSIIKVWDNEASANRDCDDRNTRAEKLAWFPTQYHVEEWDVHD